MFLTGPASFTAVCVRGRLDITAAAVTWPAVGDDMNKLRLVATMIRLKALTDADPNSILGDVRLDDVLAARILGTSVLSHVAVVLNQLRTAGVLVEIPGFERSHWELASAAQAVPQAQSDAGSKRKRRTQAESITMLLEQLDHAPDKTLARSGFELGIGQTATSKVIRGATEQGLIETSSNDAHDPRRKYFLTDDGRRRLTRTR